MADEHRPAGDRSRPDDAAAERFGGFLDALLGEGRPSPEQVADHDEAEMARLAAELSGATGPAGPGAGDPDPAFIEQLRMRMRQADEGVAGVLTRPPVRADLVPPQARSAVSAGPLRRIRISRRAALQAGLGAAAGLAAGVAGGAILHDALTEEAPGWPPDEDLVGGEGEWVEVATTDQLPPGSVRRFSTTAFNGFLVNDAGEIRALSAACTHLGCTLNYRPQFNDLRCPCHEASFNLKGWLANSRSRWRRDGPYPGDERAYPRDLPPLPRPKVKVEDDRILVLTAVV